MEGAVSIDAAGQRYTSLGGRDSVFAGPPPPVLLLAPGTAVAIEAESAATVVLADAPGAGEQHARLILPDDILAETRGHGITERRIHHLLSPAAAAGRLILFEVFTPSGHWSSYPPHKHDTDDLPSEAVLEETYHYRFRRPEAWGVQRLYGGSAEGLWAVRDGETVIVRDGYHPFVATHGDDAYYLNALAGDVRTMACSFDPSLASVMNAWPGMAPDPRVPLVP
jgi:5-deoxy-glucuronate isomerase